MSDVISRNGIHVRLPDERWAHIMEEHAELANLRVQVLVTVAEPHRILAGSQGELLAVRQIDEGKWLVVAYREMRQDGFIITAFLTRRERSLNKRTQLWP